MNASPAAIVTGAGSGIGRAVAVQLGRLQYRLALVGRTKSKLEETRALIEDRNDGSREVILIEIDLAEPNAADRIVGEVEQTFGRIDALINNAGIAPNLPIEDTVRPILQETFAVNTFAPALLIARAWSVFEKQPPLDDLASPCIINVSTVATDDPFPGFFLYAASKSAIESFTRSIAREGRAINLRAFSVAPGAVETALLRSVFSEEMIPPDQTLDPETVASVIVECIRGERNEQIGQTIYLRAT